MGQYHERILLVEDDRQLQRLIGRALEAAGFSHVAVPTGEGALGHLGSQPTDLVLLDLDLPDLDGMQVIERVREWSQLPILVVSARDGDRDKAAALDLGADDYLTKPFSTTELLARIRVALRHLSREGAHSERAVRSVGQLTLDCEKHLVCLEGTPLHVTPLEYGLLSLLFRNIGKVLTTQTILREIYGRNYGSDTQALRTLMAGLRRKIEKNPSMPRYIITEIGVGYRLVDE